MRTETFLNDGLRQVEEDWSDADGNPAGGVSFGPGYCISWQNGPLGRPPNRKPQNGAFVEHILQAAYSRLDYYQSSKFACDANARAMDHIEAALNVLVDRKMDREDRGVEGTHNK